MQIINDIYKNQTPLYPIDEFCPQDKALFIDIETTGLSKENTSLYLIGCGYYDGNDFHTRLFFADDPSEELEIIENYLEFAQNYTHLFHFNGIKFDIPYLQYKANKYNLGDIFANLNQIDVYQLCKPLRYLLFPQSMRQKCIEDFLQITREDKYNGGELIAVYHDYVRFRRPEDFVSLITHNREDVLGMHKILPILSYLKLKDASLIYNSHEISEYKDYNGESHKEIILRCTCDTAFPFSFTSKTETLYLKANASNNVLTFRLPVYHDQMKLYYENYRDYCILKDTEECIHKSVAMGLSRNSYIKATRESCYTPISGDFIKQPSKIFQPSLKSHYKDKSCYFKYPDSFDDDKRNEFVTELLRVFFVIKRRR